MTFEFVGAALSLLQAPSAGGGGSLLFVQFGLIILIFYFLVFRPQQKQRKTHETALRNLKRGERVVTAGGIVGEVIHIKESVKEGVPQPTMEDEVTIKSGDTRFINERGRIARIVTAAGETTSAQKEGRSS